MPDDPVSVAYEYEKAKAAARKRKPVAPAQPVTSIGDLRMRDEAQIEADDNAPLTPDEKYEALNPGFSRAKVREANKNVPLAKAPTTRPDPLGGIGPAHYDASGARVGEGAGSDQFNRFTTAVPERRPGEFEDRMFEQRFPGVTTRAELRKRKAAEERRRYANSPWPVDATTRPTKDRVLPDVAEQDAFVRDEQPPERQREIEQYNREYAAEIEALRLKRVDETPWKSATYLRALGFPAYSKDEEFEADISEAQARHPWTTAGVGTAGFLTPFGAATKGLKALGMGERAAGVVAGGLVGAEHTAAAGMQPGESGWDYAGRIAKGGVEGSAFMGAAGVIGDRLRGYVAALPETARGPVLDLGYRVGTEIGAFTGADLAVHGDKAALKEDAALAVAFVALGMTPRLAPPRGRGPGATPDVLTPAQRAKIDIATAIETAAPESTLAQRAAFIAGETQVDGVPIPPEMLAKFHVAAAPARAAYEAEVATAPDTSEPASPPPPAAAEVEPTLFDRPPDVSRGTSQPSPEPPAATLLERTQPTDKSHRLKFDVGLDKPIEVHVVETTPGNAELEVLGAEPNSVGMTAMRSVLRQVKDAFPDTKFSWDRLTGANPGRRAEGGEPPPDDALAATARAGVTGNAAGATNAGLLDRLPEPETPTTPAVEPEPPAPEPGRRFATGKRPPKPKEKSLSQVVRKLGGFKPGNHEGIGGEIEMLRRKDSGSTGLVMKNGKTAEELIQGLREEGFDIPEGERPSDLVERVLDDVNGARQFSSEGDAYEDVSRRAEYDAAEREAMRYEDGDATFATEEITGSTREGLKVKGLPVRETEKSYIVVDAEGKQHRVDKSTVKEPPPAAESMGIVDPPKDGGPGRGERGAVGGPLSPEERAKVDKTRRVVKRAFGPIRAFHDWVTMQVAPNISRSNKDAGATAGALVGSAGTAAQVGPFWREAVLGDMTPAERLKWDQATTEFQHRANRERRRAELASITNPIARIAKQAEIDGMYTTYKDPRAVIKSDAELDAYWNSPEVKRLREKHKAFWQGKEPLAEGLPSPEEMYRYLTDKGVDVEDLISTDPRDEMRLNEIALKDREGAETPFAQRQAEKEGRKFTTASSVENIRDKSHPYAREMTSAGKDYLWDYEAKVGETYRRVLDRYLSQRLMDRLVKSAGWKRVKDGTPQNERPTTINGEEAVRIDPEALPRKKILEDGKVVASTPGEHYYGPESQVAEVEQLLRMNKMLLDKAPKIIRGAVRGTAEALNFASLFGVADDAWNIMLDTKIVSGAPGAGLRSKAGVAAGGVLNNLIGSLRLLARTAWRPADYKARDLRLGVRGSFREARTPEWTAESFMRDAKNAWKTAGLGIARKALGRFASRLHSAGRYVLQDAYKALVKNGMAEDSPVAEREFVNRLGQYVGRGMGYITQSARDSGIFPFVTAQRKTAAEALRMMTFSGGPGTKGAAVRIAQITKIASALFAIGLWNYAKTGDVRGRKDIPIGSMDLGYDYDSDGNVVPMGTGTTAAYSDLFGDITGVRPAMTASGIRPFTTAARRGTNKTDSTLTSLINSWGVKFATSPTTGFLYRAATGKHPYMGSRSQVAPSPGESAFVEQLKFAVKEGFQPGGVLSALTGIGHDVGDPGLAEEVGGIFPSFAPKRGVRDVEALPARIESKQADDKADLMIYKFRNMPRDQRVQWIREEMRKWNPRDRAQNFARLMRASRGG